MIECGDDIGNGVSVAAAVVVTVVNGDVGEGESDDSLVTVMPTPLWRWGSVGGGTGDCGGVVDIASSLSVVEPDK